MYRYLFVLLFLSAVSCSPVSKVALNKKFRSLEQKIQNHAGFMLYDVEKAREVYSFQSNQYFIPGSNTKIFTLYTALTLLGDSIPALHYIEHGDSLVFKGTGDPSFLYKYSFDSRAAFNFLSNQNKQLYFSGNNLYTTELGPGWAWDDYLATYSSERSSFPVFGNFVSIKHTGNSISSMPQLFSFGISMADSAETSEVKRDIGSNKILFHPGKNYKKSEEWEIPFKTNTFVTADLLSDTLKKKIKVLENVSWDSTKTKTLYSIPVDSLYKIMMRKSDNFIAEQLLLICSDVLSDSLKPEVAIKYMKKNLLNDLPDKPIWIDGSGLSRYNLFTPRSIVVLWKKIYERVPQERLFPLLAIGGKAGTIKNSFKNNPPYIYGKTGTLTNNHCISGYLVTKKGKTFIFSFMSNNHPVLASKVRNEMELILKEIYTNY